MFKKCKVAFLPANEITSYPELWLMHNKSQGLMHLKHATGLDGIGQHLYFLSDEKIKKADWCIDSTNQVRKCTGIDSEGRLYLSGIDFLSITPNSCKKIIATTDSTLLVGNDSNPLNNYFLPQPPQPFIEKYVTEYNKGNAINEVLVEYEDNGSEEWFGDDYTGEPFWNERIELKIDSNNTIRVKSLKESL